MYHLVERDLGGGLRRRGRSGERVGEGVGRLQAEQGDRYDRGRRHPIVVVAHLVEVVEVGVHIHAGHSRHLSCRVRHQVALGLVGRRIFDRRSAMTVVVVPGLSILRLVLRRRCRLAVLEEALVSVLVRCVDLAHASRQSEECLLPAWEVALLGNRDGR